MKDKDFDRKIQQMITGAISGKSEDVFRDKLESLMTEQLEMSCFVQFLCRKHLGLITAAEKEKCRKSREIVMHMISAWKERARINDRSDDYKDAQLVSMN